jgi:hypothetical protein
VTSTTALTVIQNSLASPQFPRSDLSNTASDPFARHFQARPRTRQAAANADKIGVARKRVENQPAPVRDRRRANAANHQPRRREGDFRKDPRQAAAMTMADSGFVVQFIAQEIIPGGPGGARGYEIAAYESTIDRIKLYVEPFQTVNIQT